MRQVDPSAAAASDIASLHPFAISSRSRQLVLIAQFGVLAFSEGDLDTVLHRACWIAAEGVGVQFARVLQHRADDQAFVLHAGVGWPTRLVGQARVAADLGITAGIAWHTGDPALSSHLAAGGFFRLPDAAAERGIHRTPSVPTQDNGRAAFGVLEVGSAKAGGFTQHDVAFLQAVANCVAAALDQQARRALQEKQSALAGEQNVFLRELPHGVRNDLQGISGVAELEARHSVNPKHRASLDQAARHVRALAKLYFHLPGNPTATGTYLNTFCAKITEAEGLQARQVDRGGRKQALRSTRFAGGGDRDGLTFDRRHASLTQ